MSIFGGNQPGQQGGGRYGTPRRRSIGGGIIIALLLAGFSICKYYSSSQFNEITGETQHISITAEQEVALGVNSFPAMVEEYGGLHPDAEAQKLIKSVGQRIVQNSDARQTPYQYDFHLLADPNVVNAFALPGG